MSATAQKTHGLVGFGLIVLCCSIFVRQQNETVATPATQPDPPTLASGMATLTDAILEAGRNEPTRIVWLIDESANLTVRRSELADRIELLDTELRKDVDGQKPPAVEHALVGFGRTPHVLTSNPVTDVTQVTSLIRKLHSDGSEIENVFTAVRTAIEHFTQTDAEKRGQKTLLVIFTDEQGNDLNVIEKMLTECRESGVRIYCLGSVAPFSEEKIIVHYTDGNGTEKDISLDQGSETSRPLVGVLPWWGFAGAPLQQVSSGFGPFGLNYVCHFSGGRFLPVSDRAEHRFDPEIMANYPPPWFRLRPPHLARWEDDVRSNQAKQFLLAFCREYSLSRIQLPSLEFRSDSETELRTALTTAQRTCAVTEHRVAKGLAVLETVVKASELLEEARWQASFDLTMGRLLAMRARVSVFNVRLAAMKVKPRRFVREGSNTWLAVPSSNIGNDPAVAGMVARSREFLRRVIRQHPGTPFELIARKELERGFGWSWHEKHVEYPPKEEPKDGEQQKKPKRIHCGRVWL